MSSARKETERTKFIQDKCQTLLTQMLRDEDNKYCVDCDAKGPRWASWNLGVFLCIRCAGIHRNLGVHISRVRSVNLDTWSPEQVMSLQNMGNSRARAIYEAQLPDGFRRPQTDAALESFVRAKYEHKKYMAREYVPTAPAAANWDREIDEEMERQKRNKKKTTAGSSGALGGLISAPTLAKDRKTTTKSSAEIKVGNSVSQSNSQSSRSSGATASADLLELCSPMSTTNGIHTAAGGLSEAAEVVGDIFSNFLSGPSPPTVAAASVQPSSSGSVTATTISTATSLAEQEADFFNQVVPSEQEKGKMTRDSILALYGQPPNPTTNGHSSYNHFNGSANVATGFTPSHQSQTAAASSTGAFGQFSNAQLLSQLGGISSTSSPPGAADAFGSQMSFASFPPPVASLSTNHQLPTFAQFPPMQLIGQQLPTGTAAGASPSMFPTPSSSIVSGNSLAFGQPTAVSKVASSNAAGINQQFANLNMWQ